MTVLSQEEFDAKATLASLGQDISRARGELSILQAQKQADIERRRKEVEVAALEYSEITRKALEEVKSHRTELESFANDLKNYASELKEFREKEETRAIEFEKSHARSLGLLKKRSEELETLSQEISMERETVKKDRESILRAERLLQEDKRAVQSERAAVQDAYDRAKKKGII